MNRREKIVSEIATILENNNVTHTEFSKVYELISYGYSTQKDKIYGALTRTLKFSREDVCNNEWTKAWIGNENRQKEKATE